MSTPEQPAEPQLTRRQLREIRMTGATPIIGPDTVLPAPATAPVDPPTEADENGAPDAAPADDSPAEDQPADAGASAADSPDGGPAADPAPAPATHFARAAGPAVVSAVPIADANVDLGVTPLTRRQARQQERIRTASVSVVTPEMMAAHAAAAAGAVEQQRLDEAAEDGEAAQTGQALDAAAVEEPAGPPVEGVVEDDEDLDVLADDLAIDPAEPDAERPVLRPGFGSELLAGAEPVPLPPSFDQLIARNATSTGAQSTSNALILSQAPSQGSIVGPVTATGEVLITGSMALPEGLGSTGHANGTADGKETDAVLIDREIPAHSSPTPIAASAAISTVKGAQEIIRPPAPEKGSRLMLTLAITAGALALALVGVLILAFVTGAL
jgi:hypothetical protein